MYLKEIPDSYLTFEWTMIPGEGRVPVPNAKITVRKLLGDDYYISKTSKRTSTVNRSSPLQDGEQESISEAREGRAYTTFTSVSKHPFSEKRD